MTDTYGYEFEFRNELSQELRDMEERRIKESLLRKVLNTYDLSEPTTIQISEQREPGYVNRSTRVRFRCSVNGKRLETTEAECA